MAETAEVSSGFHGDKLYQQRARTVLPILVRQAWSGQPVRYESLAQEVGMPNPRNLNYPLGSIGNRLDELSEEWDDEVPHIQSLVVNKATGLPGPGFDAFLRDRGHEWENSAERRAIIREYWTKVYEYPYWEDVLEELELEPASDPASSEIEAAKAFGGGGEGEEHRRLKQFLSNNPHLVGFEQAEGVGDVEYHLPSGDRIDVVFDRSSRLHAVEVKPASALVADVTRGLFQCVKYRAVMQAQARYQRDDRLLSVCLALGGSLPALLVPLRNSLNVEVHENLAMHLTTRGKPS
ncbi:hypothetical protein J2Y58_003966 [Sphingomonas sp. BE138]|uniref:hypothetical protein n=1 Tax=Sphingomonas sp. BE138 TaxID=2817845 RepID=UPI00285F324D|nr:hypothetical protein [Sphingomonas sp. BE138]MDR6790583.1 hypothetical protein [Sphingomonas sp. BE138]